MEPAANISKAEQFILDNKDRYLKLVKEFKPSQPKKQNASSATTSASPDITVSARVRPLLEEELAHGFPEGVFIRPGTATVELHELRQPVRGLPRIDSSSFTVDRLFGPESTTKDIYETVLQPLVPWAWAGGVGTMFAYGQTGSGKTFTVSGLERCVAETLMSGSLEGHRKLYVSIIELCGQSAFDLLNSRKRISILEDSLGNTQLAGAAEHVITDKETLLGWIDTAAALRRTEATKRNDQSSRSHSVCRIRSENPSIPTAEDGLLFLVDLAGSEAARDKTTLTERPEDLADRMRETSEINTSLSVLKDCIRGRAMLDADSLAGRSTKKAYVPFRHSTLTKTLKHVFDPSSVRSCKTIVIACVNPCAADTGPTKNTLRYAEMLSVVIPQSGSLKYNPGVPASWNNEQLRQWIDKNSGTPLVSSAWLAPFETGPQLIRLPTAEFITRCLKTEGVSLEQAQAFQSKFWRLHFDSSHRNNTTATATPVAVPSRAKASSSIGGAPASARSTAGKELMTRVERLDSSNDIEDDPPASEVPFKQRIRPGMVVRCDAAREKSARWKGIARIPAIDGVGEGYYLFVVLSLASAVGERVRDLAGEKVHAMVGVDDGEREAGVKEKYLCSVVSPGMIQGSYTIDLWRQVVVGMNDMDAEVLMDFDAATRYYYLAV